MSYFADIKQIATTGNATAYTKAELVTLLQSVYTDMRKFTILKNGEVEALYMNGVRASMGGQGLFTETLDKYHLPYELVLIETDFPAEYV